MLGSCLTEEDERTCRLKYFEISVSNSVYKLHQLRSHVDEYSDCVQVLAIITTPFSAFQKIAFLQQIVSSVINNL